MSQIIQTLMHEHRLIEQVLGSLSTFTERLESGRVEDRPRLADYARFFREFADRCHHGKEEDRLFVALHQHGMPREAGPVAVMVHEHEVGREHVRALTRLGDGDGPLTGEECDAVRRHAGEYIPLLLMHIQKEDGILFPNAEHLLPGDVLDRLEDEFDDFERRVMGPDAHDQLHSLAESLIAEFPPRRSATTSDRAIPACGPVIR